ncbi:Zn-ribbon domain-containing OB-fold protein [Novosphingobium hassiacum]|uniref:Zn-ribbon domain-containing OB-fold protein n=1 Tax=Novosphingobium hassiacum TaxID=173676 RepID=UPI001FE7D3DA|nr:OB-fold domain-containing protein [Novosphingobium hassiacum]
MERPYPRLTPENAFFWTSGSDGTLRFLRCASCGHFLHPPLPRCPICLGSKIASVAVSGRAKVVARTINHHAWHAAFPPPYLIALVEIAEAPYVRLTTRIINCEPDEVEIGAPVRVVFERQGPAWLPLFELEPK